MNQKRRLTEYTLTIAVACIAALSVSSATAQDQPETSLLQDDVKTVLFKDADTALTAARAARADILAPKNFGKAMKRYQEAEADLEKGDDLDDIRENLRKSVSFFQKAIDATKLAEVTFPNSMKARGDAQTTESVTYAPELWTKAEKKLNEAAGELEDGDLNNAKKKASEAETLYRQAELVAIKANYLDETRELLKQAKKLDVKDRAPVTLLDAQQLIQQAEKELNENRYDTDVARNLAQQAKYQAKHAIYLSKAIKQSKDEDESWEDLMLASETPLQQIAEKTGRVAAFDSGLGKTAEEIIAYIGACQDDVAGLSQELNWKEQEIHLQQARIAELEQQLGTQAEKQSMLAQQLGNQAKTRETFANVERSFSREEARVLREDYDIIIRLVGLRFPSGEATIERQSFALLTKLRRAIDSFPESSVSVLGYTDSYGGDALNLQLSEERAEAVKQYLLANMNLSSSQIEVVGYGESQPIATNATATGRAANRRVEVVIHPALRSGL